MTESEVHRLLSYALLASSVPVLFALLFLAVPYGRHARGGWGPEWPSRVGWIVMESPSVLVFAGVYALGPQRFDAVPLVLASLWLVHYVHRAIIYPLGFRHPGRPMPAAIAVLGAVFNLWNSYLNARWISSSGAYDLSWLATPWFWSGVFLFFGGMIVNRRADSTLRALRKPGETGYSIPRGGLYRRVSCPNYLGEIVEWSGWAVATASLPGLAFAVFTAANLIPRALSHHRWYAERFPDYPRDRKAVLPFVL